MPVVLTHLPHLALALAALGLAARVEVGPLAHRPTPFGLAVAGLLVVATVLVSVPVLQGAHPSREVVALYLAAGGLGALRAGWVTPRRLGLPGMPGALAGVAIGLVVGLGYLVAGLVMTHGTLLAGG